MSIPPQVSLKTSLIQPRHIIFTTPTIATTKKHQNFHEPPPHCLTEQVVKLLKIQNAPLSYINAKTDNLNTYVIVTSINILSQAHAPPAL